MVSFPATPQNVKLKGLRVGTRLMADDGFTCIRSGARLAVMRDKGGAFVKCSEGKHHLDGQLRDDGTLSGFWLVKP